MPDPAAVLAGALSPVLVFLAVTVAWRGLSSGRREMRQDLVLLPLAAATAVFWHPGLLHGLFAPRANDTFFYLTNGERAGLVAITFMASLALLALSVAKTRAFRRAFLRRATLAPGAIDLAATTLLALLALALAPPLFHAGFRRLFPDLPAQRVVEGLPSAERLRALAFPAADGSLADHAAAVFLWTLVLACLLGWLLDVRRRRRAPGALQAGAAVGTLAALWWLAALAIG